MEDNNYFIGVDVGATISKAVTINSSNKIIVSKAMVSVQGDPEKAANHCLKEISNDLDIKIKKYKKNIIATGQNGEKISVGDKISEITCIGAGANYLDPNIRIIVDVGSFSMKCVKICETGKILDYIMNYKCAAGSGILLELVGEGLELNISELADVAAEAKNPIKITSQCSIFAESEVISYKNEGANIPNLVAGVCNSVAGRVYPMIRRLDNHPKNVAFSGGVAKNEQIIKNLEERLELNLLKLPIDPQFLTAYGAAVLAKKRG